jgi:hypothetical protein
MKNGESLNSTAFKSQTESPVKESTLLSLKNSLKFSDFLKLKEESEEKITKGVGEQDKKKKSFKGCNCKNTNCLRLFCECFRNLGYCSESCRCLNCLNNLKFKKARDFVVNKTQFINKNAFSNKQIEINGENSKNIINRDGCNCKKNCDSKYCGCKKFNAKCSNICRCDDCTNNKIFLDKSNIQKIYKPSSRKKDKIIFEYNENKENSPAQGYIPTEIVFKIYKKK